LSYNGSGVFQINTAGQPVVTGTTITSTAFNALTADLASGLTTCITKDGQTTPTANIPMGNFKITGLGQGTAAGQAVAYPAPSASVIGTTTNDSAATGYLGEIVTSTVASGAGVSLVSGAAKTITSISLTAGDWDVFGMFGAFSNTSISSVIAGASVTTNTDGAEDAITYAAPISGNQTLQPVIPTIRVSIASTTTIYLVGKVSFAGTCVGYGRITARRSR